MIPKLHSWLFSALLVAAGALSGAAAMAPVRVYTVPVAPWTFPKEPERGVASEYLRYFFDAAGVPVSLGTLPYLRVINGLRDGSNAAAILIPDAERDVFALRLCQVTSIRSGVLYKKSRFSALSLERLGGLTVGIQRGTHALDKLLDIPGFHPYLTDSIEQGLRMLEIDRLDAAFLSNPGSDSLLRAAGLSATDYGWLEVAVQPVVIYVSRKSPLAQDAAALQRLRAVCGGSGRAVMERLMLEYR